MTIIFSTIHGSHLYGMAGPTSDLDTYTVTTSAARARHTFRQSTDDVVIGWDHFIAYAFSGSHQAVEALFSQEKVWHSHTELRPYLDAMFITGGDVLSKYGRTITKFAHSGDFKRRRHACRLWLNMQELRMSGRFNPRMTHDQIVWATMLASSDLDGAELAGLLFEGDSVLRDERILA